MVDSGFNFTDVDGVCVRIDLLYQRPPYALAVNSALLVVFLLYMIIPLVVLRVMSASNAFLRRRSDFGLLVLGVFGESVMGLFLLREALGRQVFPCTVYAAFTTLIIPLVCAPVVARLMIFYNKSTYTKRLQNLSLEALEQANFDAELKKKFIGPQKQRQERMLYSSMWHKKKGPPSDRSLDLHKLTDMGQSTQFVFGLKIFALILSPYIIAIIVRESVTDYLRMGCLNCILSNTDILLLLCNLIFIVILCYWALYRVRKSPDPMGIVREIRRVLWTGLIFPGLGMILATVDIGNFDSRGVFTYSYFYVFGMILIHTIQVIFPMIKVCRNARLTRQLKRESNLNGGVLMDSPSYVFGIWYAPHEASAEVGGRGSNLSSAPGSQRQSDLSVSSLSPIAILDGPSATPPQTLLSNEQQGGSKASDTESQDGNVMFFETGASSAAASVKSKKQKGVSSQPRHRYGGFGPNGEIIDSALSVLLHDPAGLALFEEYVTSEFSPEGPRFVLACEKWRNEYETSTVRTRFKHGIRIYALFVFENALLQVNLSGDRRKKLDMYFRGAYAQEFGYLLGGDEEAPTQGGDDVADDENYRMPSSGAQSVISTNGVREASKFKSKSGKNIMMARRSKDVPQIDLPRDLFDEAADEIFLLMCSDSYPRFMTSDLFKTWRASEPENALKYPSGFGNQMIRAPPPSLYFNSVHKNKMLVSAKLGGIFNSSSSLNRTTIKEIHEMRPTSSLSNSALTARKRLSLFFTDLISSDTGGGNAAATATTTAPPDTISEKPAQAANT